MFTQNYRNYRHAMFFNTDEDGSVTVVDCTGASVRTKLTSGHLADIGTGMRYGRSGTPSNYSSDYYAPTPYYALSGVYFGSGSTPANLADYKLESYLSGLSITSSSVVVSTVGDGQYSATNSYIVRNGNESEVNIYEIGVFTALGNKPYDAKIDSDYIAYMCLMERTVLTEPITIPAGESKLVTYKITFNQTLNVENTTE